MNMGSGHTIGILRFHAVRTLDLHYSSLLRVAEFAALPGGIYGYLVLTGPAKRNLTMCCIIQAYLLSIAHLYWLLSQWESLLARCHALQ